MSGRKKLPLFFPVFFSFAISDRQLTGMVLFSVLTNPCPLTRSFFVLSPYLGPLLAGCECNN